MIWFKIVLKYAIHPNNASQMAKKDGYSIPIGFFQITQANWSLHSNDPEKPKLDQYAALFGEKSWRKREYSLKERHRLGVHSERKRESR